MHRWRARWSVRRPSEEAPSERSWSVRVTVSQQLERECDHQRQHGRQEDKASCLQEEHAALVRDGSWFTAFAVESSG